MTTLLGIFPHEMGEIFFHIGTGADIRPPKTQSENNCKHFNSVLQTPTVRTTLVSAVFRQFGSCLDIGE
jgi:hypothetical protein